MLWQQQAPSTSQLTLVCAPRPDSHGLVTDPRGFRLAYSNIISLRVPWHKRGGQRTAWGREFSPSTMCIPRIELKSPVLVASAFTCCAISPVLLVDIFNHCFNFVNHHKSAWFFRGWILANCSLTLLITAAPLNTNLSRTFILSAFLSGLFDSPCLFNPLHPFCKTHRSNV